MRGRGFAFLLALSLSASAVLTGHRLLVRPSDVELDAAAAHVRAAYRAGDAILVAPPYLVGPRQRLGDLPLWEPRHLEAADLRGRARVHLVELPRLGGAALAEVLAPLGQLTGEQRFGDVRVTTWNLASDDRMVFDLRDGLPAVTVTARYADGVEVGCDNFQRDRWVCPRDPGWSYVGPETLDIDGQPRDCVWLHPLPGGAVLRVRLPRLAPLARGEVVAGFGFTADAARRAAAPVAVRLEQAGQVLASATIPVAPGWRRLSGVLAASSAPVELVLETANNGAAHLCGNVQIFEVGR